MKKLKYKNKFEITYTSSSQIVLKKLQDGSRVAIKSQTGQEIYKINIYRDQFLVGLTPESIIVGDTESKLVSEIPWRGSGNEKYDFSNEGVCMIYNAGELILVE